MFWRKEIFPKREMFPPLAELFTPLGNSFSPKGEIFPPLPESFLPLEESFPLRRESFPLRQNWWIMHRKSFSTINNGSLLRDSAFVSGYKAIIFIHTLFRRQNRIFPISCGLFRQRGEITKLGKNQVVLI